MAVDIATLGLEIDIRNAERAAELLDRLSRAARGAGSENRNLGNSGRQASQGLATISQGTQNLGSALVNATRRLLGFRNSMTALHDVTVRVDDQLNIIGEDATRAGAAFHRIVGASTLSQMNRIVSTFQNTGVAINRASSQMEGLTQRMERVARNNAFRQLAQDANLSTLQLARLRMQMGDISGAFSTIGQGIMQHKLAIAAAVASMGLFAKSCLDAQVAMERLNMAYGAVFGASAQEQIKGVYEQANRVGLKFMEAAEAAKGFFAAGKGTAIEKDLQGIFKAVTDAGAALQLSTEEVNGALLALGQMISKGKVQAEELRGQLGERLPGAFRMAAEAMGMTTAELDKFMADGKLTAEDLLPKLAVALEEKFGEAAVRAADTVQGSINRMETEWMRFKARIMNSGPVVFAVKFVTDIMKSGNDAADLAKENARIDDILKKRGIKPEGSEWVGDSWGMGGKTAVYTEAQRDQIRALEKEAQRIKTQYEDIVRAEEQASSEYRTAVTDAMKNAQSTKRRALEQQLADLKEASAKAIELEKANPASKAETITKMEAETKAAVAEIERRLADLDKKAAGAGKKAASAAKSAAVSQADYTGELERTKNSISSLQQQLGLDKTETFTEAKIKAQEKYNATISKTNEELAKQVAQGKLTQGQADALKAEKEKLANLQLQLDTKKAQERQDQKNVQLAQGQLKFYKELGQLSGNYGNSVALQNRLLEQQAQKYRKELQISEDLIQQWLYYQQLQNSQDPFDGAYRGLLKFSAEYSDAAKQWESLSYNFGKNFMSTTRSMFDDFLDTGKLKFDSFKNLFKQLLKDLAWQAIAQPILLSVIAGVTGVGGGTAQGGAGGQMAVAGGGAGGGTGDLFSAAVNMGQNYALGQVKNQLFGSGSGSLMGGITDTINSTMASWFPSTFAASSGEAAVNTALLQAQQQVLAAGPSNLPGAYATIGPTQTFTGSVGAALGPASIGAGLGSLASPYINSLLGLQNNQGSSTGSLIGGLAGTAAAIAAANIWNPGGWVVGGIAALGSLLGGGIGSLFGGQKKHDPRFEADIVADLWRPLSGQQGSGIYGGASAVYDEWQAYRAAVHTRWGASGQGEVVNEYAKVAQSVVEQSWAVAESLGEVSSSLKEDYLRALESQGTLQNHVILDESAITQENIENFIQGFVGNAIERMASALGEVDLRPVTRASDGLAVRTVEDISGALEKLFSFVNTGMVIEDEDLRASFTQRAIEQMVNALQDVNFAPLAKAADGFAVDTMEELTKSLEDMFSLYDLSANLQDETAKKAFQQWAQTQIEQAFTSVDLSFLRVDFDKNSFQGLQQAYAATQAWKTVTESIERFLHPAGEVTTAMEAAEAQFDDWIGKLRELGWQENAIAEVEAKRTEYLGEYRRQLENEMRQNLSLRYSALAYGSDSREYALQSLLFQQANERDQWKQQYGENSGLYQIGVGIQQAELTQTLLNQFKAMRDELLEQQRQAAAERIQNEMRAAQDAAKAEQDALRKRMQALQEEISAKQKLINETERLSDKFWRLARSLEQYRRSLWSGEDNLTGSRYDSALNQFNSLYRRAIQGDQEAYDELEGKASELLQLGRDELPTRGEYNDLFYDVDQKLKEAQLYAEQQATEADKQLEALNRILEALNAEKDAAQAQSDAIASRLQQQQATLQAQLDALNNQTAAENKSQYTLEQINAAINLLSTALNAQLGRPAEAATTTTTWSWDWERLIQEKIADLNAFAYKGDTNWTRQKFLDEVASYGVTLEEWYQQAGKYEGYTLHAIEATNSTLDRNATKAYKQADQNTSLLNTSLLNQIAATGQGNSSLSSLLGVNQNFWPQAISSIGGLNGGLYSIFEGVGGVNSSLGTVNSSIGGLNSGLGSVNSSIGGVNTGLSSIYDAIISFAASLEASLEGSYGGSTTDYGGSTTDGGGSTSVWGGGTGEVSSTPIYGSTGWYSERDMMIERAQTYNLSRYQGRNDWTPENTREYILQWFDSIEAWYRKQGKEEIGLGKPSTTTEPVVNPKPNIEANPLVSETKNRLATPTGIYGSYYPTERDLLIARTYVMNKTNYEGRNNWNHLDFKKMITDAGMTVEQWYKEYGKAEGYARGGITPANRPFIVGEEGPELMMSPVQYGVLSNKASRAVIEQDARDVQAAKGRAENRKELDELRSGFALLAGYLRQIVVKTDKTAYNTGSVRDIMREWNDIGLPQVAEDAA